MKKTTTTTKDAATRFWGKNCEKGTEKNWATCVVFTDSIASDGHVILSHDKAEFRDYTPNSEGRISSCDPGKVRAVMDHYLTDFATCGAPRTFYGHFENAVTKNFSIAVNGRQMAIVANDVLSNDFYMQDGATLDYIENLPWSMKFDSVEFQKFFKRFKVIDVQFVPPTNKEQSNGYARFKLVFKGENFTGVLLQCLKDGQNEDAENLAAAWATEDRAVKAA